MNHTLGTGLVSWTTAERIVGRYGTIALFRPGNPDQGESGLQALPWSLDVEALTGKMGMFVATMNGKDYDLGGGTFFTEQEYGNTYVGLKPDDGREEEWLNVKNLYKVDFQLSGYIPVELTFVEVA